MYGTLAFFLGAPGLPEIVIVSLIVLLLFGKRVPQVMGSLGRSIVEFKKGVKGEEEPTTMPEHTDDPTRR